MIIKNVFSLIIVQYTVLYVTSEKAVEVNTDRKSRAEHQRWLTVNTDKFSATPAAKLAPNVMCCNLLDLAGMAKMRSMWSQ